MADLQRMAETLLRSAETRMRYKLGDPDIMRDFMPADMMDVYERARCKVIEVEVQGMLDELTRRVERNLEKFKDGK